MANRPDYSPDVPLTAKEIAEVRLRYAQLSRPGLRDVYTKALQRCRLDARGRAPHSVHIQVLVQAWKASQFVVLPCWGSADPGHLDRPCAFGVDDPDRGLVDMTPPSGFLRATEAESSSWHPYRFLPHEGTNEEYLLNAGPIALARLDHRIWPPNHAHAYRM
jgi:hypothetical protein